MSLGTPFLGNPIISSTFVCGAVYLYVNHRFVYMSAENYRCSTYVAYKYLIWFKILLTYSCLFDILYANTHNRLPARTDTYAQLIAYPLPVCNEEWK